MKILKIAQDYYTIGIAKNPNTPPDILRKILERGNNDYISRSAAENTNCPPDALIKWMRETGKIGKEDPNKHIIEYDSKEENIDEDFEKLKNMVSSSFNLKR